MGIVNLAYNDGREDGHTITWLKLLIDGEMLIVFVDPQRESEQVRCDAKAKPFSSPAIQRRF